MPTRHSHTVSRETPRTKKPLSFLASLVGLLICGCPSVNLTVFEPLPIEANGPYTHSGSGIPFLPSVGYFHRGRITQYDPKATDIGVGYNLNDMRYQVTVSVYVYPAPRVTSQGSPDNVVASTRALLFESHFETVKAEIVRLHPDAAVVSESNATRTENQMDYGGLKVIFEYQGQFAGQDQVLASHAYLFDYGKWLVKYRITYPKESEDRALPRIEDFMSKFTWAAGDGA